MSSRTSASLIVGLFLFALLEALAWRADVALLEADLTRCEQDLADLRRIAGDYREVIDTACGKPP